MSMGYLKIFFEGLDPRGMNSGREKPFTPASEVIFQNFFLIKQHFGRYLLTNQRKPYSLLIVCLFDGWFNEAIKQNNTPEGR